MKTLYIECKMGAAGDMLMAALFELLDYEHKEKYLDTMNHLFGEDINIKPVSATQCGISGTHMKVTVLGTEEVPLVAPEKPAFDKSASKIGSMESVPSITTGHIKVHTIGSSNKYHDEHSHGSEHSHGHSHVHSHGSDYSHDHSHGSDHSHGHSHEHSHGGDHSHNGHGHYSYASVLKRLNSLPVAGPIIEAATSIYRTIGEAEAKVHNTTIDQIHFHEVGSVDAIADVLGCCLLFSYINADQIFVSPIHVGNGTVKCAHGELPVPAPATAEILKGIPYYTGNIPSELCTPTGAAILKYFADDFCSMPVMTVNKTGFGLGTKEFPVANGVRAFLGETMNILLSSELISYDTTDLQVNAAAGIAIDVASDNSAAINNVVAVNSGTTASDGATSSNGITANNDATSSNVTANYETTSNNGATSDNGATANSGASTNGKTSDITNNSSIEDTDKYDDVILELSCNLDDMTGEALGYAMDIMLEEGALDVFYSSIYMKKNRPGILFRVLCEQTDKDKFTSLIFKHTTTRGIRYQTYGRAKLESTFETVITDYGEVRKKISSGYGVEKAKYEFEDMKKIASENGLSLSELISILHAASL